MLRAFSFFCASRLFEAGFKAGCQAVHEGGILGRAERKGRAERVDLDGGDGERFGHEADARGGGAWLGDKAAEAI